MFIMFCLLTISNLKLRKFLGKINPQSHRCRLSAVALKECVQKSGGNTKFINLSKAFDSIHRGKIEQIQQAFGFLKETVIVML